MHGRTVQGYCPLGCGETLFLSQSGRIRCNVNGCPRPYAVDELLADRETDHIVTFTDTGFTVKHPLRERLDDALLSCLIHDDVRQLGPLPPGRYRAQHHTRRRDDGGGWSWEALDG